MQIYYKNWIKLQLLAIFLPFSVFIWKNFPSGSAYWMRIRIQEVKWMQIRIHSPALDPYPHYGRPSWSMIRRELNADTDPHINKWGSTWSQLGTQQHCRDNGTTFSDQTCFEYGNMFIFDVGTQLIHRGLNIFRIFSCLWRTITLSRCHRHKAKQLLRAQLCWSWWSVLPGVPGWRGRLAMISPRDSLRDDFPTHSKLLVKYRSY